MTEICVYAQVHQPYRLRQFRLFDIGSGGEYFDDDSNRRLLRRVADKCYLPTNRLLADLIRRSNGEFKVALSLSGALLDQCAEWAPDVLQSFQDLVGTGGVELLGETYFHSLAALISPEEFAEQVEQHRRAIYRWLGQRPTVFRNTDFTQKGGIPIRLGSGGMADKIDRLEKVLPDLQQKIKEVEYVDLNYPRKVVVKMRNPEKEKSRKS